ncbi:hypothetical protein [Kitasatospora sp. NPDC091207]|uniref:hypothetical protein n=1 Tax=Kitasatospora sp. NPDC091207 TaxID=3364083 RepID=UPI00380EDEF5
MGFEEEAEEAGGYGLLAGARARPASGRARAGTGCFAARYGPGARPVGRYTKRPAQGRLVLGYGPGVPDDQGELLTVHRRQPLRHVGCQFRVDALQ